MKKIVKYPTLVFFALFIICFSVLDLIYPTQTFSETENRTLAQKPGFTVEKLFNGQFTTEFESYTNDQFVGRDEWISLKSMSERALLKIMNNNIVYGNDGYLFDLTIELDEERVTKNLTYLREFLEMYQAENVWVGMIPSSSSILTDKLPKGFPGINELALINQIETFTTDSQLIDLVTPLRQHKNEYIYYRTDHHWTTLGAYYAYQSICESLGLENLNLEKLTAQTITDFKGTYYAKAKNMNIEPDTMTYYEIDDVIVNLNGKEYNSLYDSKKFAVTDKYSAFIYGNNGLTQITTENSPQKKLLVIKDSYTN
ncbi:MAG: DHHW family protein, partial [Turicibacter sp.]